MEKFNLLGSCSWLILETIMEKTERTGSPMVSKVELDDLCKLNLPERFNKLSEKQLVELATGKLFLVNRGKHGKAYKLEVVNNAQPRSPRTTPPLLPPTPMPELSDEELTIMNEPESQAFEPNSPLGESLGYYSQRYY